MTYNMKKLCLLLILSLSISANAQLTPTNTPAKVMVEWEASVSSNITNYTVYYGVASGVYTNKLFAGTNLTLTITPLIRGVTYYFAATCTDSNGLESAFSNEASLKINQIPSPPTGLKLSYNDLIKGLEANVASYQLYNIERSKDLINWTNLTTVISDTNGYVKYVDANATNKNYYYKLTL